MRTIKQALVILLVLLLAGYIATNLYLGSSDREDGPRIFCPEGTLDISAADSEDVLLKGITASDNQDGDLTDQIIVGGISKLISNNTAKVTYLVFDSDDNMASCIRYIRYTDYQRPRFQLNAPLVYSTTENVSLLSRISATDVVDGDISKQIRVSTLSPTSNSEIYNISVQVANSVGDTAFLQLPVLLLESDPMRPTITLTDYLIYLDQGSSFDPAAYVQDLQVPDGQGTVSDIKIENPVDTATVGSYQVAYTYVSNGSIGTAILTVVVV